MRLTNNKIMDTVKEAVGEDALPVVEFLKDKKNISEFKIAEKVKMEVNQVRNILYRLNSNNLATYHRKKDRQKGWYISYWTFNKKRVKDLITELKISKIKKYKKRLAKEEENKGNYYMCQNACVRLDFEHAVEFDFKCPECGNLLNNQDNSKTIEFLKEKIKELEASV